MNTVKNSKSSDIDLNIELQELRNKIKKLQKSLDKHQNVIKEVGLDASIISSELKYDFSAKSLNLQQILNDSRSKNRAIISLQSGINIMKGTVAILQKFKHL